MEQSAQLFDFENVEKYMDETRTSELSAILGVCAELINRFRKDGLTVDEADKVAMKLGEHPAMIWEEWSQIETLSAPLFDEVEKFLRTNKLCLKCDEWVPRDKYHRRSASKDGIARYCVSCMKAYEANRRKKK